MAAIVFTHRLAGLDDLAALRSLMDLAIGELQKPFLTEAEISSSPAIMGLDTQLIADGTYFLVEAEGHIAGCGGWPLSSRNEAMSFDQPLHIRDRLACWKGGRS